MSKGRIGLGVFAHLVLLTLGVAIIKTIFDLEGDEMMSQIILYFVLLDYWERRLVPVTVTTGPKQEQEKIS